MGKTITLFGKTIKVGVAFIAICFVAVILMAVVIYGFSLFLRMGENHGLLSGIGGCYLQDAAFSDTASITSADQVITALGSKYPVLKNKKDQLTKIITKSQAGGINPAVPIAIWAGEQTFGNDNAAFGCGVYAGSPNQNVGFDSQLSCVVGKVQAAINNQSPYDQPKGANIFTRLFYNYTEAMKTTFTQTGYVANSTNARVTVLQTLMSNAITCASGADYAGASFIQSCQSGSTDGGATTIVIDPGHGTPNNHKGDPGDASHPAEAKVVLEVATAVTNQLRAKGYTVYMTRNDPSGTPGIDQTGAGGSNEHQTNIDNQRRAQFGNSKGAALNFRIHSDSGTAPGFYLMYPGATTASADGHVGPTADVAAASKTISQALSQSLAGQGITKAGDPKSDPSIESGKNLIGSSWSATPISLIEMWGTNSGNAVNAAYKQKMETAIANAIAASVPLSSSGGTQAITTSATKTCAIANFALNTAMDVKKNECPDGQGCRNNSSTYTRSASKSNYASTPLQAGGAIPRSWHDFADCGKFAAYVIRSQADASFPPNSTVNQLAYVKQHPEKYTMISNTGKNLLPGDIVFKGWCNVITKAEQMITGGENSAGILAECKKDTTSSSAGHVQIYTGDNSLFPGKIIVEASLDNRGPMANTFQRGLGGMGLIARIKN